MTPQQLADFCQGQLGLLWVAFGLILGGLAGACLLVGLRDVPGRLRLAWGLAGVAVRLGTSWEAVDRRVSALFTVAWDPCGRSRRPIAAVAPRECPLLRTFVVLGTPERGRRVAAWVYRRHEAPSEADWRQALALFGLDGVPPHTLDFSGAYLEPVGGPQVAVRIALGAGGARGSRTVELLGAQGGPARGSLEAPVRLGGLAPGRLAGDALGAGVPARGQARACPP